MTIPDFAELAYIVHHTVGDGRTFEERLALALEVAFNNGRDYERKSTPWETN